LETTENDYHFVFIHSYASRCPESGWSEMNCSRVKNKRVDVLVIGGGVTGAGLLRDLALRGLSCLLVERRNFAAGASGGNHGLLHSGARYVCSDSGTAGECARESELLKKLAPHCIDDTGGLFVAVPGDPESYIAEFPNLCDAAGVPYKKIEPFQAMELEPTLAGNVIAAYEVRDASIDPFMLTMDNAAHAISLGAEILTHTTVESFDMAGGRIAGVRLKDQVSGEECLVEAGVVVNATGAWAGMVAGLAGVELPINPSKGSLVVTQERLAHRVINRLRKAADSDIVVPGGSVSILGTTSLPLDHPDECRPTVAEVDAMIEDASAMMPILAHTRYIRAFAGVRPLFAGNGGGNGDESGRDITRGVALLDHAGEDVENFVTITGGKLTTYRLMAENTADLVCRKLGNCQPCRTRTEPLPKSEMARWNEPKAAPRAWARGADGMGGPEDRVLCECEMVPASVVERSYANAGSPAGEHALNGILARSRVGRGSCQGAFCSLRITSYLYGKGKLRRAEGLQGIKSFINRRWKGVHPVLWDTQLVQAELQEAMHCGFMGLELERDQDG
jgi:glycerol-3-phosphate dehydrogenase